MLIVFNSVSKSTGVVFVLDMGKIPPIKPLSMIEFREYQIEAAAKLTRLVAEFGFGYLAASAGQVKQSQF